LAQIVFLDIHLHVRFNGDPSGVHGQVGLV
jgi:hypothetical protein